MAKIDVFWHPIFIRTAEEVARDEWRVANKKIVAPAKEISQR